MNVLRSVMAFFGFLSQSAVVTCHVCHGLYMCRRVCLGEGAGQEEWHIYYTYFNILSDRAFTKRVPLSLRIVSTIYFYNSVALA